MTEFKVSLKLCVKFNRLKFKFCGLLRLKSLPAFPCNCGVAGNRCSSFFFGSMCQIFYDNLKNCYGGQSDVLNFSKMLVLKFESKSWILATQTPASTFYNPPNELSLKR